MKFNQLFNEVKMQTGARPFFFLIKSAIKTGFRVKFFFSLENNNVHVEGFSTIFLGPVSASPYPESVARSPGPPEPALSCFVYFTGKTTGRAVLDLRAIRAIRAILCFLFKKMRNSNRPVHFTGKTNKTTGRAVLDPVGNPVATEGSDGPTNG